MKRFSKFLIAGIAGAMIVTPIDAVAAPMNSTFAFSESMLRFAYDYKETITRTYISKADIPQTYYYEYYNNNWNCWFRGTLKLTKTAPKGKKFIATFTGTMYGSPT